MRSGLALATIGTLLGLSATAGWAHPLDPALLELRESKSGAVEVVWRLPVMEPTNAPLQPVLPSGCAEPSSLRISRGVQSLTQRWRVDCGLRGLVGERVGIQGLHERGTDALLRIHLADGRLIQAVLRGDSPFLTVPERTGLLDVAWNYVALGFEHILTGPDHLLFVLGLVLLVPGWRMLLWTITAFTLGHSVTLSLAVLGFVHVPPAPVEVLIALSILIVAVELTHDVQGRITPLSRFPWAVALVFGFLHGLGFAGVLAQVGLPTEEIPFALFSFNLGIECGQLLFVLLVVLTRAALSLLPTAWPQASKLIPAYVIGSLAAFWVFQRVAAIY